MEKTHYRLSLLIEEIKIHKNNYMQTTLFKITLKDGRIFKVFCANATQIQRFVRSWNSTESTDNVKIEVLENGIHDIKQWESIITNLN